MALHVQLASALYSNSHDERAVDVCLRELQEIGEMPR